MPARHLDGVRDACDVDGNLVVDEIAGGELARAVAAPAEDGAVATDRAVVGAADRVGTAARDLRDPVQLEFVVVVPAAVPCHESSETAEVSVRVDRAEAAVIAEGELPRPLYAGDRERTRRSHLVLVATREHVESPADHPPRRLRGAADQVAGGDVDRGATRLGGRVRARTPSHEDGGDEQAATNPASDHRDVSSIR